METALRQWDGFVGFDGERPLVVKEVGQDGVPLPPHLQPVQYPPAAVAAAPVALPSTAAGQPALLTPSGMSSFRSAPAAASNAQASAALGHDSARDDGGCGTLPPPAAFPSSEFDGSEAFEFMHDGSLRRQDAPAPRQPPPETQQTTWGVPDFFAELLRRSAEETVSGMPAEGARNVADGAVSQQQQRAAPAPAPPVYAFAAAPAPPPRFKEDWVVPSAASSAAAAAPAPPPAAAAAADPPAGTSVYDALAQLPGVGPVLCLAWVSRPHAGRVSEAALRAVVAAQLFKPLRLSVSLPPDAVKLLPPSLAVGGDAESAIHVLVRVPQSAAASALALSDARESWYLVELEAAEGEEDACPVLRCEGFIPPEEE